MKRHCEIDLVMDTENVQQSFQEEWSLHGAEIEREEREAVKGGRANAVCYHYARASQYGWLSENSRLDPFSYDGEDYKTAQHAYQCAWFGGEGEKLKGIRGEIMQASEPRQAKEIAEQHRGSKFLGGLNLEDENDWRSREYMYDVMCHKFNLRGPNSIKNLIGPQLRQAGGTIPDKALVQIKLGLRLVKTGDMPIFRVAPKDLFWGLPKPPETEEDLKGGQNWSGRILTVIRQKLALELALEEREDVLSTWRRSKELFCPVATPSVNMAEILRENAGSGVKPDDVIAGRYHIERLVPNCGLIGGSYAGNMWICIDKHEKARSDLLDLISNLTARKSFADLKCSLELLISNLIDGSTPNWEECEKQMGNIEKDRFPEHCTYPGWWRELQQRVRIARDVSTRGDRGSGQTKRGSATEPTGSGPWALLQKHVRVANTGFGGLAAAHMLHMVLHKPVSSRGERRVFLKTFKSNATAQNVLHEILMCSTKSPDLKVHDRTKRCKRSGDFLMLAEHDRLCHHQGLSAILGASHKGLVQRRGDTYGMASTVPFVVPFVALEYCGDTSRDLYDLTTPTTTSGWVDRSQKLLTGRGEWKERLAHLGLIRSIMHQVVLAVRHMHHVNEGNVTHGDLKIENVMVCLSLSFSLSLPPLCSAPPVLPLSHTTYNPATTCTQSDNTEHTYTFTHTDLVQRPRPPHRLRLHDVPEVRRHPQGSILQLARAEYADYPVEGSVRVQSGLSQPLARRFGQVRAANFGCPAVEGLESGRAAGGPSFE